MRYIFLMVIMLYVSDSWSDVGSLDNDDRNDGVACDVNEIDVNGIEEELVAAQRSASEIKAKERLEEDPRCPICLEDIESSTNSFSVMPCCSRGFHKTCIEQALNVQNTCPLCRAQVRRPNRDHREPQGGPIVIEDAPRMIEQMQFGRPQSRRAPYQLTDVNCRNVNIRSENLSARPSDVYPSQFQQQLATDRSCCARGTSLKPGSYSPQEIERMIQEGLENMNLVEEPECVVSKPGPYNSQEIERMIQEGLENINLIEESEGVVSKPGPYNSQEIERMIQEGLENINLIEESEGVEEPENVVSESDSP